MRVAGSWVGLGPGDSSDEIRKLKAFLRRKFSYAKALADTPDYDDALYQVVYRMQSAYNKAGKMHAATGIVDVATKVACGYVVPDKPKDSRPMLFSVCGTGVPWWVGPDADTARAVEDRFKWQPIGYRAAPFPMNDSVQEGREELCHQFELWRPRIEKCGAALMGYSQGAIVTGECWEFDIKPPEGRLHWAMPHMVAGITFGNPMRERGRLRPDPGADPAPLSSHGIADQLMVNTPDWWLNFAHRQDLYTDCEGQSGEDKTAIYKIIMGTRVFEGPDNILAQFAELFQSPVTEGMAMFQAIMDAGLFFIRGTGPHVNYDPQPAIQYLRSF
jgi:hypothetical protein